MLVMRTLSAYLNVVTVSMIINICRDASFAVKLHKNSTVKRVASVKFSLVVGMSRIAN